MRLLLSLISVASLLGCAALQTAFDPTYAYLQKEEVQIQEQGVKAQQEATLWAKLEAHQEELLRLYPALSDSEITQRENEIDQILQLLPPPLPAEFYGKSLSGGDWSGYNVLLRSMEEERNLQAQREAITRLEQSMQNLSWDINRINSPYGFLSTPRLYQSPAQPAIDSLKDLSDNLLRAETLNKYTQLSIAFNRQINDLMVSAYTSMIRNPSQPEIYLITFDKALLDLKRNILKQAGLSQQLGVALRGGMERQGFDARNIAENEARKIRAERRRTWLDRYLEVAKNRQGDMQK